MGYAPTTVNDVKTSTTLIHKGKIAPKGSVFLTFKLKRNGSIHTANILIDRSGCDEKLINDYIEHHKNEFYNKIIKDHV